MLDTEVGLARIFIRSGLSRDVPVLKSAELGWDVDTATLRVGNDTSAPFKIISSGSRGYFDLTSLDGIKLKRLDLLDENSVIGGVRLNTLSARSGIVVSDGSGAFSHIKLTSSDNSVIIRNQTDSNGGNVDFLVDIKAIVAGLSELSLTANDIRYVGAYETSLNLINSLTNGSPGNYAFVEETNSFWAWKASLLTWINTAAEMKGATSTENGVAGVIKAPLAGQQNSYYRGDNTWVDFTDVLTNYSQDVGQIATDNITLISNTHGVVFVDTEGLTSSDNLTTIIGGTIGQILSIAIKDNSRQITVLGTGNIKLYGGPVLLDSLSARLVLQKIDNTNGWVQINTREKAIEKTLVSDAILIEDFVKAVIVDTEASAASDNLATINGGTPWQVLTVQTKDSARDVTIKTSGNIRTRFANDFVLADTSYAIVLQYNASQSLWVEIGRYPATFTASLDLNSQKLTSVASGVAATDGVNLRQVQTRTTSTATVVAGTVDAITLTFSPPFTAYTQLTKGIIQWVSTGPNTVTAPPVNIDTLGNKTLKRNGGGALLPGDTGVSGRICQAYYNGTDLILLNPEMLFTSIGKSLMTATDSVAAAAVLPIPANLVRLTSGTGATYVPTTGTRAILIECIGGGGGGGGADGISATCVGVGDPGGGGGFAAKLITNMAQTFTYTIGAGGTGGSGANPSNNGTAGGNTVFTASVTGTTTATGGNGGIGDLAQDQAANTWMVRLNNPVAGGSASGASDYWGRGMKGLPSLMRSNSMLFYGTAGSPSRYGGGVNHAAINLAGTDGAWPGEAGAGAAVNNTTNNYVGGNGFAGVIIITEYF